MGKRFRCTKKSKPPFRKRKYTAYPSIFASFRIASVPARSGSMLELCQLSATYLKWRTGDRGGELRLDFVTLEPTHCLTKS